MGTMTFNGRSAALVLLLLSVCALHPNAQTEWTEYSHGVGRLSVAMPCAPAWKTQENPRVGTKAAYTSYISVCRAGDDIYILGWVDYEATFNPEAEGELLANRDSFIKGVEGAQLLTSTSITYAGLPALDFTARLGDRHITSRVVIKGRRPYQLAIATPLNTDRSQHITRFMSSFRVLPD